MHHWAGELLIHERGLPVSNCGSAEREPFDSHLLRWLSHESADVKQVARRQAGQEVNCEKAQNADFGFF